MSKIITKIEFEGKVIGSRPLFSDETLTSIRSKIKEKTKNINNYQFLDTKENYIEMQDEDDYKLSDIIKDKKIKIVSGILDNESIDLQFDKEIELKPQLYPILRTSSKHKFDLSKYKEIKNNEFYEDNLKIYSYSEKKGESNHEGVYEYFYDEFDLNDYKDAYIILFFGKTGDGKSTAINALFNIVKGVKLDNDFRFILISEKEKNKNQAVSQTEGVHLYYVKDYDNKPIIIIDSQGFGDIRGPKEDKKIIKAFSYVFTEIVDHINAFCFIIKATNNRLDILIKYIFNSITSLFTENTSSNFIILASFANKETIKKGPDFIETINQDESFFNINKTINKNYWFAFDSKSLFDDEINTKLTKYSYEQLCKLYEEKVKKLVPISTKESGQVITNIEKLKKEVNNLYTTFKDLTLEQSNLKKKEKSLNEMNLKIMDMENQVKTLQDKIIAIDIKNQKARKEYEGELRKLNESFNKKLNELSNKKYKGKIKVLEPDQKYEYTYCNQCKENCHNPCDCRLHNTSRCKIFPVFGRNCEKCGHFKEVHKQNHYHYIYIEEELTENIDDEKNSLKEENEKLRIEEQKNIPDNFQKQLNKLKYYKEDLLEYKRQNENEKKELEKQSDNINRKMKIIIMKLKMLSEVSFEKGMNRSHIRKESEYIDSLGSQMKEMGYKDEEIKEQLSDIKKNNELLESVINIPQEELLTVNVSELMDKYIEQNKNK